MGDQILHEKADRAKLRVLDLFSGIGGFSLGLERTGGFETVAFCEIDPFCRKVLEKHWPNIPCHDDVTTREFSPGEADIIVGGFPCQDVSCAGQRAGLSGARSGLYRELVRAIRVVRPRYAILENVAALLSNGLGTVLGDLAESGFDAEWDCVPACALGAPHERDRVWIVAHPDCDREQQSEGSLAEIWRRAGDSAETRPTAGNTADPESVGRRSRREGRPPDSFARVRDEARRNTSDPYGARLAFREGFTRDAWEELPPTQRDAFGNVRQSVWPDEPALSGVDDGIPDWMDRVKATGNTVLPQIPELIGIAILNSIGVTFAEAPYRAVEINSLTQSESRLPAVSIISREALPGRGGIVSQEEECACGFHVPNLTDVGMQRNAQEGYEDA